jgi:lactate dehydrogenase-like 2-hydroxyacid dehydrogenase
MKKKILIADKLIQPFEKIYKLKFNVDCLWKIKNQSKLLEYEAVIVTGGFKTNKYFLKKFKNLKIISVFGVGYDGVDIDYCKKNSIQVTNTPDVLTNDVSDLAIGFLISLSRKIINNHNYTKKNKWLKSPLELNESLTNKKVGIVGMGKIGTSFAKKAKAFNLDIFYYGPNKKKINYKYYKNLKKMAKEVNFLVITCKGGDKTNGIINQSIINSLSKDAYIINISRGSVINEIALLEALKNNKIKGAALDVFNNEPNINPKFKKLKNVILSPHHASGTKETRNEMAELSCNNVFNFFTNKKPIYKIKQP